MHDPQVLLLLNTTDYLTASRKNLSVCNSVRLSGLTLWLVSNYIFRNALWNMFFTDMTSGPAANGNPGERRLNN